MPYNLKEKAQVRSAMQKMPKKDEPKNSMGQGLKLAAAKSVKKK